MVFKEFGMVRPVFIDSLLSLEANKVLMYLEFGTVDLEFGMVPPAFINSFLLF